MAPTAGTRLRFKKSAAKGQAKHQKKVPSLKNRIRALERFLKRGGSIDDKTRAAKTRELEQLQNERNEKERVEEEKKNAEKYKKPRFFERVKLMRKLKKAESQLESADDKKEKRAFQKEYDQVRHDLMYLYYYPKAEQYLSLFPAKPHSDENLKRQEELRKAAIARFEEEQPLDAFHKFCYADGNAPPAAANAAAILQVKKPTKEEEKKKLKKKNKKDKKTDGVDEPSKKKQKKESRVLADEDDVEADAADAKSSDAEGEEEEDDFFL